MQGLTEAQVRYDRQLPVDIDQKRPDFDPVADTEQFIRDLATTERTGFEFFEDRGVADRAGSDIWFGGADILRNLCRAWVKDPEAVHAVCGTTFFQEMKELASHAYDAEEAC